MSLTHQCPSCAHITEGVPEDWVGRVVRCKVCGERSKVLERVTPVKGVKRGKDEGVREIPGMIRQAEQSKPDSGICRGCGNDIRLAIVCDECKTVVCSERCLKEHLDMAHAGGKAKRNSVAFADAAVWLAMIAGCASFFVWPAVCLGAAIGFSSQTVFNGRNNRGLGILVMVISIAAMLILTFQPVWIPITFTPARH